MNKQAMSPNVSTFFVMLQYDVSILLRSWIIRFWFSVTFIAGIVAIVVSSYYADDTSFLVSWALLLYAALGGFVVLVISTSAISLEFSFLGDTLISRGIAPTPYVLAKLAARALVIFTLFNVIVAPTAFIMQTNAISNDMSVFGITVALIYWSFMLMVLVFLGITFSVIFDNTLVGVVVLAVVWYGGMGGLIFIYAPSWDHFGVLGNLPLVLQGKALFSEIWTILGAGLFALITLPFIAVRVFNARDL
jgi:hypothetical protein